MEEEGLKGSVLSIAQATKARPQEGQVIAQVKMDNEIWNNKAKRC